VHLIRGFDAVNRGPISGTFEVAGQQRCVVFVVFDQQDAQGSCSWWLALDLVRLIWGAHRVV
jgi:hypothetical protein